ncbi:cytochrome c(L), periplasmic [Rubrimonas cliftonensis]|uniref:Cytochrome c-L n=1 Tax=Rubrimonas cliftonensis TaxID=89524 RepID=A0A1H4FIA3_9RHOB|nr:cytochrome c(L), periplasmic [Rubrimonas cliftonensis]SEA96550.1 cytochrome cL apoprotein [Rubrimonas cliftonensis]
MSRLYTAAALSASLALSGVAVWAGQTFYHVTEGTPLDLSDAMEEGRDTEAVKHFFSTGVNLYNENPAVMAEAEEVYAGMCSGCHGHYAEGKIGPGLNDDYWSYPQNEEDAGLFATVYGGARGQMGPMWGALTLDEMLLAMAWVRHLYTGAPETAIWLTPEQRAAFKPFEPGAGG